MAWRREGETSRESKRDEKVNKTRRRKKKEKKKKQTINEDTEAVKDG